MANIVTSCRILFSILMLFPPAFSAWFYTMYLFCGLTDMVDGTIARKTNTDSNLTLSFIELNYSALVAIVLLNLCGRTFSTPNFFPISRNRNSTPLSVSLLCGLFNDTNNAILLSVLNSI